MEIKLIELYCLICHIYDTQSVLKHQRLSNFKPVFTDQELVACYFLAMLNNQHKKARNLRLYPTSLAGVVSCSTVLSSL
jgi:hypothetical protein